MNTNDIVETLLSYPFSGDDFDIDSYMTNDELAEMAREIIAVRGAFEFDKVFTHNENQAERDSQVGEFIAATVTACVNRGRIKTRKVA